MTVTHKSIQNTELEVWGRGSMVSVSEWVSEYVWVYGGGRKEGWIYRGVIYWCILAVLTCTWRSDVVAISWSASRGLVTNPVSALSWARFWLLLFRPGLDELDGFRLLDPLGWTVLESAVIGTELLVVIEEGKPPVGWPGGGGLEAVRLVRATGIGNDEGVLEVLSTLVGGRILDRAGDTSPSALPTPFPGDDETEGVRCARFSSNIFWRALVVIVLTMAALPSNAVGIGGSTTSVPAAAAAASSYSQDASSPAATVAATVAATKHSVTVTRVEGARHVGLIKVSVIDSGPGIDKVRKKLYSS